MTETTEGQIPLLSLEYEAWLEAEVFKWLESEKVGFDVGHDARCEWARRYWDTFCRWRLLDHLHGRKRFKEFCDAAFGCLKDPQFAGDPVVEYVIHRFLYDRWENLHFLFLTPGYELPREPLVNTLNLFRINDGRHTRPRWYTCGRI